MTNTTLFVQNVSSKDIYLSSAREVGSELKKGIDEALDNLVEQLKDPAYRKALKELEADGVESVLQVSATLITDDETIALANEIRVGLEAAAKVKAEKKAAKAA